MMLVGRTAVVTGASGGLGRAIALALAAEGAKVIAGYARNSEAVEALVKEISDRGGVAFAVKADVSVPVEADALIREALERGGAVDILVNNAGIKRDTLLMRMKEEDWDSVIRTNLTGIFNCTKAATRPMVKARFGRIVNIASVAGLAGNAGQANYSAAKAGVIGFTKAVARELASRGITVNAIAPGAIAAGMVEDLPPEVKEAFINQIPLARLGRPEDVAAAVVFFASEGAQYITGQTLAVDGGMTMQ